MFLFMLQVDPVQSYLNLNKLVYPPVLKAGSSGNNLGANLELLTEFKTISHAFDTVNFQYRQFGHQFSTYLIRFERNSSFLGVNYDRN